MSVDAQQVRSIFLRAVEEHRADDWPGFLDAACDGNADLRDRVEALLRAHLQTHDLLDHDGAMLPRTIVEAPLERPGTSIGPYKLMEQIGEGGMGLVFVAEQRQPVRRKVALKVIKPGMDTREVIARFEAERQALALMDHPNIARVLDAGATGAGRPYFVMELVRGAPITTYCDDEELATEERLKLFVAVCRAVQHAHQKGVIHRDIKPSNILVTLHDGEPVAKVIDFGVAKAVNQRLTEKTIYTAFRQMLGTPLYMSPEQADLSGLDIDTRTDIYSLGVLLYELLTGTTPFERARLNGTDFDEVRRILREEEPPRPSTRISTLGRIATTVSARRRSDPKRLKQLFRRELDWIVMKALEKDRDRRYETAAAFANDVEHHLNNEPVLACPPSAAYRFRKFARRNKRELIGAGLLLAVVSTVMGLLTLSNWRLRSEQERTAEQFHRAEAMKLAADEHRAEAQNRLKLVLDALDEVFVQQAERLATPRARPGAATSDPQRVQAEREFLERGLHFYEQLAERPGTKPQARLDVGRALRSIGMIQHRLGHFEESLRAARRAARLFDALVAEVPNDLKYRLEQAESHQCLYWPLTDVGEWPETEKSLQATTTLFEKMETELPDEPRVLRGLAECYDHLVLTQTRLQRATDAARYFDLAKKSYARLAARFPQETEYRAFPNALRVQLAICLHASGQAREAADVFREAAVEYEKLIAEVAASETTTGGSPTTKENVAWFHHELGFARVWQGRVLHNSGILPEAEAALRQGLESHERLVAEFPTVANYRLRLSWNRWRLGLVRTASGDRAEAERLYRAAIAVLQEAEINGEELGLAYEALSDLYGEDGRTVEAIEAGRKAVEAWTKLAVTNDAGRRWQLAGGYDRLGAVLKRAGRLDESQEAYQKGGEVWEKLVIEVPNWADYQLHFLWNRQAAGELYKSRGDVSAAEKTYRDAVAVLQNTEVLDQQPTLYEALSDLCAEAGRLDEAVDARGRAVEAWRKLADKTHLREHRRGLASAFGMLGHYLNAARRFEEAEEARLTEGELWEKLAADFPPNEQETSEHVGTDLRLGEVRKARGNTAGAERAFRAAVERVERTGLIDGVAATACGAQATFYAENGRFADAVDAQRKAEAVWKKLADKARSRDERSSLAHATAWLSEYLKLAGRLEEAEDACLRCDECYEMLSDDFPPGSFEISVRIYNDIRLGELRSARGDAVGAEQAYKAAAERVEQAEPTDMVAGAAYEALAAWYQRSGRLAEAIEVRQKQTEASQKRAEKTGNRLHRQYIADDNEKLADLLNQANRTDESKAARLKAREVLEKLAADFPGDAGYTSRLAEHLIRLGNASAASGDRAAAEAAYTQAATLLEKAGIDDVRLGHAYHLLSQLYESDGRIDAALEARRKSLAACVKLASQTNLRDHRWRVADAGELLAALLKKANRLDEAEAAYRDAAQVWRKLAADFPTEPMDRLRLAWNNEERGALLARRGSNAEALEITRAAVALHEQLAAETNTRDYRRHLAVALERLPALLRQSDRGDEADTAYCRAAEIWEGLVSEFPEVGDYRQHLALNQRGRSELLAARGGLVEAIELEQKALALWGSLTAKSGSAHDAWKMEFDCQRLGSLLAEAEAAGAVNAADCQAAFQQARADYEQALRLKPNDAALLNCVAWLLATSTAPILRDPPAAVELAKRAVQLEPKAAHNFNTLGVSQYRAGNWSAAIEAIMKSESLGNAGAAGFDWYFLAMAHWQLGHQEQARTWYDQAVEWTKEKQPNNEELRRVHTEAEALLGGDDLSNLKKEN